MTDSLADYERSFSAPERYLNFASFGPPSDAVSTETTQLLKLAGEGADPAQLHETDNRAIAAVSRLTGFGTDSVVLTPNTTFGLLQLAFGLPRGEVLISAGEFPGNLYPWWRAQEAGLLRVRTLGDGSPETAPVTPERIAASLTEDTIALAVSAVDFRTGFRADLAGLREAIGDRLLIVDGIQGFGVIDAPWTAADALVVGGQKWVRAGWGTGFVALSERGLNRIRPLVSGWSGVENAHQYDGVPHPPLPGARRFSVTNGSPIASGAFASALELIESVGIDSIEARVSESVEHLLEALTMRGVAVVSPMDEERRAGIVVARIAEGASAVHARLRGEGFSTTLHGPDRIRISVHATTTTAALDAAAELLTTPRDLSAQKRTRRPDPLHR
ncbi:hypothetical protein GCM10027403_17490 [Arthrobacter tecti]